MAGISIASFADALVLYSDDLLRGFGYYLAGGTAGVVSRTATAPFDRLKVYLIANTAQSHTGVLTAAKTGNISKLARNICRPIVSGTIHIWKDGGIRSFFAGNGLNVIKILPESAIKFGSFEAAKKAFAKFEGASNVDSITPLSRFLAGGVAGVISQGLVFPIDTIKL